MLEKAAADIDLGDYIDRIEPDERASDDVYAARLKVCQECSYLNAGLCRACGCYVELRAYAAARKCPYEKW